MLIGESETSTDKDLLEKFNCEYLKKYFGKLLPSALSEIISVKPYDPIEYLGHWLLYFKVELSLILFLIIKSLCNLIKVL